MFYDRSQLEQIKIELKFSTLGAKQTTDLIANFDLFLLLIFVSLKTRFPTGYFLQLRSITQI